MNSLRALTAGPAVCWDVFCTVVDNFGDIGVSWRLARQLANEHQQSVRLWVDDLDSFRRLCPEVDSSQTSQFHRGVEIRRWENDFPVLASSEVADVVIEAFGCSLPPAYVEAMARRAKVPVWINLEYLSAEEWVVGCHALPSPHPRLPLTKYFFFPGFVEGTGGLLRERSLTARRRAFQNDPVASAAFWRSLDLLPPSQGEVRVSLFAYDHPDLPGLVQVWSQAGHPMACLVPEGSLARRIGELFGREEVRRGDRFGQGNLEVVVFPFLEQDRYDQLLWACDVNFVRGEDSFVRAQWAGRPLVWQIYRQEEEAHLSKLEAFISLYCQDLPAVAGTALSRFLHAWNRGEGLADSWPAFLAQRRVFTQHAGNWVERLAGLGDLAGNLVLFSKKYL